MVNHGLRPWIGPRELDEEDFNMMNLPRGFWNASYDKVTRTLPDGTENLAFKAIESYRDNLKKMRYMGYGLILFGENGVGKTSALSCLLKEFRSYGQTALYANVEHLRQAVFKPVEITDDYELWDWSQKVDVLLLDDLGKEHRGKDGPASFAATELNMLLRVRADSRLVTLITTNQTKAKMVENYSRSMLSIMQTRMLAVHFRGPDLRTEESNDVWSGIM